jgi:hypothetical protein
VVSEKNPVSKQQTAIHIDACPSIRCLVSQRFCGPRRRRRRHHVSIREFPCETWIQHLTSETTIDLSGPGFLSRLDASRLQRPYPLRLHVHPTNPP